MAAGEPESPQAAALGPPTGSETPCWKRPPPPPRLAPVGLLHLDDLGAEPRQRLGAGRPRLELGEVEYLDSGKRRRRGGARGCGGGGGGLFQHGVSLPVGGPSAAACGDSGSPAAIVQSSARIGNVVPTCPEML